MVDKNELVKRINSNIDGLDEMLNGGFFKGSVNVVTAPTGAGKTVLGGHFVYHAAMEGERCLCITTSERSEYMKRAMLSSFGWDLWELEEKGKIRFIDISDPGLRLLSRIDTSPSDLINSFNELVTKTVKSFKPDRIFIDSLDAIFLAVTSGYMMRSHVDQLFKTLRNTNATSVLSCASSLDVHEAVEYAADTSIEIGYIHSGNSLHRSIHINKMRGSSTIDELRVLNISDSGMKVLHQSPYIG